MSGSAANTNTSGTMVSAGAQEHLDKVVSALHTAGLESMVYTMAETSSASASATATMPNLAFANFPTPVSLPQVQVIQQPYLQQLYAPTLVPGGITFQPAQYPFSLQLQQAKPNPNDPKQQLLSNLQAHKGLPHGAVFATAGGNKMVVNKLQAGHNQPLLLGQLLTAGQPTLLPATSKPQPSMAAVSGPDKRIATGGTLQPKTSSVGTSVQQQGLKQYPGGQVLQATSQTTQILGSFQPLAPAGAPPQMMGHPGLTWAHAPTAAYLPNQPIFLRPAASSQADLILQPPPQAQQTANPQPASHPMAALPPRPRMMRPASSVATQTAGIQSVPISNVMPQASTAQVSRQQPMAQAPVRTLEVAQHKFRSLAPKSPDKPPQMMASQQQQHYQQESSPHPSMHHHHQPPQQQQQQQQQHLQPQHHHVGVQMQPQPSVAKVVAMPTASSHQQFLQPQQPSPPQQQQQIAVQASIATTTTTTATSTPIVFHQPEVMEVSYQPAPTVPSTVPTHLGPTHSEPPPTVPVLPQQHAPSPSQTSSSDSSSSTAPATPSEEMDNGKAESAPETPPPSNKTPPPSQPPIPPPSSADKTTAIVKPQILTHFIDGFVIHEGPDPFPITRSSLKPDILPIKKVEKQPRPGKKRGPKPGRPREMAKCEFCGVISAKSKFKKSKRFCTKSCAKRYNANCAKRLSGSAKLLLHQPPLPETTGGTVHDVAASVAVVSAAAATIQGNSSIPSVDLAQDEDAMPPEVMVSAPEVLEIKVEPETAPVEQQTASEPVKNIATWTVDEVVAYVRTLPGCAEYAEEFLQQEIDGQALMLLKEDHLMTTMSMKLGPALKMFSCISSLRDVEPSLQ